MTPTVTVSQDEQAIYDAFTACAGEAEHEALRRAEQAGYVVRGKLQFDVNSGWVQPRAARADMAWFDLVRIRRRPFVRVRLRGGVAIVAAELVTCASVLSPVGLKRWEQLARQHGSDIWPDSSKWPKGSMWEFTPLDYLCVSVLSHERAEVLAQALTRLLDEPWVLMSRQMWDTVRRNFADGKDES